MKIFYTLFCCKEQLHKCIFQTPILLNSQQIREVLPGSPARAKSKVAADHLWAAGNFKEFKAFMIDAPVDALLRPNIQGQTPFHVAAAVPGAQRGPLESSGLMKKRPRYGPFSPKVSFHLPAKRC